MMARILISSGHTLVAFFHARQNALESEDLLHLFSIHCGLVSFQEQVSPIQLAIEGGVNPAVSERFASYIPRCQKNTCPWAAAARLHDWTVTSGVGNRREIHHVRKTQPSISSSAGLPVGDPTTELALRQQSNSL